MNRIILWAGLVLLLVTAAGCKPQAVSGQPGVSKTEGTNPDASGATPDDAVGVTTDTESDGNGKAGKSESLGIRKYEGELYSTKYGQAMVAGVAVPTEFYCIPGTPDWKPEILAMKGKMVVMEGEAWRYHCMPTEQCDISGHMDSIRQLKYLRVLE